jgi:SAM-dependent methyltransferase
MWMSNIIKIIIEEKSSEIFFSSPREFGISPGLPKDIFAEPEQESLVWEVELQELLGNQDLHKYLRLDAAPVPATQDREGYYADRHLAYWLSGLFDYLKMLTFLPSLQATQGRGLSLLDWGGASGRVARHFCAYHPDISVTVVDINRNHADFINNHFPGTNLRGVKISSLPFLPFADDAFDVICAFSVFTHIDSYEIAWLAELSRTLKPGGLAYLTIHSEYAWESLSPNNPVYNAIKAHPAFKALWQAGQKMPQERLVFPYRPGIDYSCHVFFHSNYIKRVWAKFLHVEKIIYNGTILQDVVVMRKSG